MNTELDPTTLAIEYLRSQNETLTPAQYLTRVRQLRLEFADLLELTSVELLEEIAFAHRLGLH
ncbi:YdiH family protein [Entomohabitans teleogrylli]|uniref:YdiH family protein n=1 Tax=Entomohabitans teleogrylli TaxID=1384589 RepID=UPI00073D2905|nr:YdiH family protein [Entomohabitans teleogrylli]